MDFLKKVFSEPDGTPSASRVLSALVLTFALGWITAVVVWQHQLPSFEGVTAFLAAVLASLYGVNKVAAAYSEVRKPPNPPPG